MHTILYSAIFIYFQNSYALTEDRSNLIAVKEIWKHPGMYEESPKYARIGRIIDSEIDKSRERGFKESKSNSKKDLPENFVKNFSNKPINKIEGSLDRARWRQKRHSRRRVQRYR